MNASIEYYEVRHIATGFIIYRGRSLTKAVTMLEPGTCYGKGPTPRKAHGEAQRAVSNHGSQISLDTAGESD